MLSYEGMKTVHIACVAISVSGFVVRYALRLALPSRALHPVARVLPHVNDTILLAAAIAMLVIARVNPLGVPWLAAKLVGLFAYIRFGIIAMRNVGGSRVHIVAFGSAIACFGYVISVALTKSPWGISRNC